MSKKILHITNGDSLTERLNEIHLDGDIIVWREMLCEGPTVQEVGSNEFITVREKFLKENYDIPEGDYEEKFISELEKFSRLGDFDEIILWFEFDLFCHINMLSAISYLIQNKRKEPIYLVCSGRVKGEKELKGLSELSDKQLMAHYESKIHLTEDDLEMAAFIWELYCGHNPNQLKPEIRKSSNFKYLSSCIRAHLERYPNAMTGLNTLETNVLKLIHEHLITSEIQLCGYVLNYQGYYGYGDVQIMHIIKKLKPFYEHNGEKFILTREGELVLAGAKNFYQQLKNDSCLGGTNKYDFLYDPETHQLLKL
ncbi:MAG: DUF1835 domain-containing protein [Cytophagaceae bacterium]|nr:DUF1835 domain-containing protein [Cytophagaceae bacterium]|tara:strand:- start:4718 stop:5650 length:933 start_codon:yes stop_codon:yes gene_type:complete